MIKMLNSHDKIMQQRPNSSWESSHDWYDKLVGTYGHYYHEKIVLPNTLKLLNLKKESRLLDMGCGQGILARHLNKEISYLGIDASPSLIRKAEEYSRAKSQRFLVHDLTKPLPDEIKNFTHATLILALQNMEDPLAALKNAAQALEKRGALLIVLNHPCFRIPRQSSWQVDPQKKLQYRRIDRYFSPLKIPIQTHPSKQEASSTTWSYHHPLSAFSGWLKESGFVLEVIEEWRSDKMSMGKTATMENRAREEFPLFLTILARKL